MPRKTSDIMIRIEKSGFGSKPSLNVWYNGFEASYPSIDGFLRDIRKHIKDRFKLCVTSKDLEYIKTQEEEIMKILSLFKEES